MLRIHGVSDATANRTAMLMASAGVALSAFVLTGLLRA